MKFDQDSPSGLSDILVQKCGQTDGQTTQTGDTFSSSSEPLAQVSA